MVVFTVAGFSSPATFDELTLRKCLISSGAVPIKVVPPVAPALPAGTKPEIAQAFRDRYEAENKAYHEAVEKWGVSVNPTVVLATSDGELGLRLGNPAPNDLLAAMGTLPTMVRGFWRELPAGLEEAKAGNKPAVVVFTARGYQGPVTFASDELRKALGSSGAVPIRVLPPEPLILPKDATPEQVKELKAAYEAADKKYRELLTQYGVSSQPALVILTSEGDVVSRLTSPTPAAIIQTLAALPKLVEEFKAAKAKAEAAK